MVNINSKTEARKKVREAQMKANEARLERERHHVDDAASFLVELARLGRSTSGSKAASKRFAQKGSGAVANTARSVPQRFLGCRRAEKLSLRSRSWTVSKSAMCGRC
jgi:hypothetical protein